MSYKTSLLETYNRHAAGRNEATIADWKIAERQKFLDRLQAEGKQNLLELGAGTGHDAQFFAQAVLANDQTLAVTCADLSPEMVKLCQAKGLNAEVMDLLDLRFDANSFDAVWAANCLLHLTHEDLPTALLQIKRVLKTKGLFYLRLFGGYRFEEVWGADHYTPKRFYNFYPDEEIQAIVGAYFEVLDFYCLNTEGGGALHTQVFILRP